MTDVEREIRSGWLRQVLSTAMMIISIVGSTWYVVSTITEERVRIDANEKSITGLQSRVQNLEDRRLPDAVALSNLQVTLNNVARSLDDIKTRLDRIENRASRDVR